MMMRKTDTRNSGGSLLGLKSQPIGSKDKIGLFGDVLSPSDAGTLVSGTTSKHSVRTLALVSRHS